MALFDEKIDELLAKHLAGECSAEEEQAISRWLDESSEHQTYLEELRWLWEHSAEGLPASPRQVNTEEALQQVKSRLQRKGGNSGLHWQRNFFLRAVPCFSWPWLQYIGCAPAILQTQSVLPPPERS